MLKRIIKRLEDEKDKVWNTREKQNTRFPKKNNERYFSTYMKQSIWTFMMFPSFIKNTVRTLLVYTCFTFRNTLYAMARFM